MDRKFYSIRVIPEIPKGDNEDGSPKKPIYIRKTNPNAKTRALKDDDDKSIFPVQRMLHLQLFEEDAAYALGGDTKPYTETIFENTDPILFEKIEEMIGDADQHKILATQTKVMVLEEKLPGLVKNRTAPNHFALMIDKEGAVKRLKAQKRDSEGNFQKEDVILSKVSYFLFANQVNEEDDLIRYAAALKAIKYALVEPTDDLTVATALKAAEVTEELPK